MSDTSTHTETPTEDPEIRLRRLKMRSWRRGMKEMDLILGRFADTQLDQLTCAELDAHEILMEQPDQDLFAWINGTMPIPEEFAPTIDKILSKLDFS